MARTSITRIISTGNTPAQPPAAHPHPPLPPMNCPASTPGGTGHTDTPAVTSHVPPAGQVSPFAHGTRHMFWTQTSPFEHANTPPFTAPHGPYAADRWSEHTHTPPPDTATQP